MVLRRLSIRTKWPLAVASLILLVGVSITTAAYFSIRRTAQQSAEDRLLALGRQYRQNFENNAATTQARLVSIVNRPELAAYLENPMESAEPAVIAAIQQAPQQEQSVVRKELRDRAGRVIFATDGPVGSAPYLDVITQVDWASLEKLVAPTEAAPDGLVMAYGRLILDGDAILYPVVTRMPANTGGFFVTWRRVADSSTVRQQIAQILGSEAGFFYGNADGGPWSDLGRPTQPPIGTFQLGGVSWLERPGRGTVLAAVAPVASTPWVFSIEFPLHAVLAPARSFLRVGAAIAGACILIGMVVAWVLSRRVAGRVQALTLAADEIAAGTSWRIVNERRGDELGRLAASFDGMARQIEDSQQRLKGLIAERTGELRAVQDSLARREKLALVGQLAGSIGHEIRNPLGVMANAIYFLEAVQADAPQQVRDYLRILKNQVDLSTKIVNDLLDLSRTTPAARERVALRNIVSVRLQRVSTDATRVETDIPADLPDVQVDPVHVGHIVDNLLNNAVQAMDGATGTISVRARDTCDGFVRLEVSDTGPGVAAEHAAKIFEPLFTTKARGIGLGLALSKSLAQANGGDLSLVSPPGHGATFAFTLPVAEATA